MSYIMIVESFERNPRDVCTFPLQKREPLWFYVYAESGKLWIDTAKSHNNSSSLNGRRLLKAEEYDKVLDIYHRRCRGEPVSKAATEATRNQVYWYGVFRELHL